MNFFSDRRKLEQEYFAWLEQNPGIKDCPFTVISFLEGAGYLHDRRAVGTPESNRRFINSLPNRKFAELTINSSEEPDYEYNYDDELELWGFVSVYTTSDGSRFDEWEAAIDHEAWWLDQPHKEEPNG